MGGETQGKRFELLKEIIPKLSRVGFFWSPTSPIAAGNLKEIETVARHLRVGIQSLEVKTSDDIEGAFQAATNKRLRRFWWMASAFFTANQKQIIDLAIKLASGDGSEHSVCRGRWTDDLRGRPFGAVPARRRVRG